LKGFLLKSLVSFMLVTMLVSVVYAAPPTVVWSDPVGTNDIALSRNGQYVVVASGNQVRYYGASSGTPLWISTTPSGDVISVAISADGDCVVAGTSGNSPSPRGVVAGTSGAYVPVGDVVFWKNARTLTGNPAPTWSSVDLGGQINRRCLDISDDGNYVVACGTGEWVFYWANTKGLSGSGKPTTWKSPQFPRVECVDLSSDGDYVTAGIWDGVPEGFSVAYWKNARTLAGNDLNPYWKSYSPDDIVVDIAISDDGDYVAAATGLTLSVHYWANAKSLTGTPDHTWYYGSGISFNCIDMSSDGNAVTAGTGGVFLANVAPQKGSASRAAVIAGGAVYFWSGAKGMTGKPQNPTWTYTTEGGIHDVAIDDTGSYIAADQNIAVPIGKVYFFNSGGSLLWSYSIDGADKVSMSGDGATLAVGTSALTHGTAYLLSTGYSSGPRPVGGVLVPVNKLEILTPYIALAGLIAAVSTVVAVKRRRE